MSKRKQNSSVDSLHTNSREQDAPAKTDSLSKAPQTSPKSAHPVDKGWAWAVMIGVYGVHFLTFGYIRSFGILFVEFQTKFEASSAMTAVVNGAQFCTYSLSTFLAMNVITKHFSFRQCCLLGCVFESVGILLNGIVTDIRYLILTQGILFGSGLAFLYCPALIILSHYFNEKRAIATSIATSGVSAGGMTLPPLMRYLLDSYGLRGGLLLLAGIMFHQVLCAVLFIPPSKYSFAPVDKPVSQNDGQGHLTTESKQTRPQIPAESQPFITNEDIVTSDKINGTHPIEELSSTCEVPSRDVEESSHLLRQVSDNLYPPRQSDKRWERTTSLDNENHKENSSLSNSVITSYLNQQSHESPHEHSFSQADISCEDSQNKMTARSQLQRSSNAGSVNNHGRDMCSTKERYISDDNLTFAQIPPRRPSLKETLLEALSTSSLDLRCNVHTLGLQNQRASIQRFPNDQEASELTENQRRRCRLPPVIKTLSFWIMLVFFGCGWISSALPTIFLPPLAKEKGLNDYAAVLLMASALAELVGRLGPGIILQFGFLRPHSILIVPLAACGTLYQFTALFNDLATLLTMAILSGLFTGVFWSMQSLVVIEVFGLDKLGEMLGFYFLIAGFSVGASNPISGLLRDISGTYASTFQFFGAMYYVASAMMVIIVFIMRGSCQGKENQQRESRERINQDDNPLVLSVIDTCHSINVLDDKSHITSVVDDKNHSTSVLDDRSHVTSVTNDKCQISSMDDSSPTLIYINR